MRGTVKFFDKTKGWGFIKAESGAEYFLYYGNIVMDGFKTLNEDDIVNFEIGNGNDVGKEQAINVTPILTRKMIEDALEEDNLYVENMKDAFGQKAYMVVDQNNVIQSGEQGMAFLDLATYAGFDVEGLMA